MEEQIIDRICHARRLPMRHYVIDILHDALELAPCIHDLLL
jgi:hypothetical protein